MKRWEDLSGGIDAKQAARYLIAGRLAKLRSCARHLGQDASEVPSEAIHQTRVGCRRVQSALGVLGTFVTNRERDKLSRKLKKLRRIAGRVRQWDVLAAEMRNIRDQATPAESIAIDHLLEQYRPARASEIEKLASRARKLKQKGFWDWTRKHFPNDKKLHELEAADRPQESLLAVARRVFGDELKAFDEASHHHQEGDVTQLHLLRLAVKRLRYVTEVFAGCLGPNFRTAIYIPLARWQESLGVINDAHEFAEWFDQSARNANQPELTRSFISLRDRYVNRLNDAVHQFRLNWSDGEPNQLVDEIRHELQLPTPDDPRGAGSSPLVTNPERD